MSSRSYRLEADDAVPAGIARIARGRIDDALDELEGKTESSPEETVHEARKDMKKLRALVRLVRDELGDDVYRREMVCFRDAGQELSGLRDADVMLATLGELEQRYPEELPAEAAGGLRQALEAHKIRTAAGARTQAASEVVETLRAARERVDDWPLEKDGFEALEGGLERSYRRGRRALRAARAEPTDESLHEWRKRAKDLWYHVTILRVTWPPVMEALGDEAHELSNHLGDDHDLAVLRAWAHENAAALDGAENVRAFDELVQRRRLELQRDAFALGARLYADKPRAFIRRLERWWDASAEAKRAHAAQS
jgi:CHAD domain-containing protein